MRQFMPATCLTLALAALGCAQTFEVASIKVLPPSNQGDRRSPPVIEPSPGSLIMRNVGIGELMMWSFKIGPGTVANIQTAMAVTDRFDVTAKAPGPATTDELRVMMQNLMKERFKLAYHRETKEAPAYVLVEAKGGHKLKPSENPDHGRGVLPVQKPGVMALAGQGATLDQLTMFLSAPLRAPVIDQTGLKGRYDFEFDLTSFGVNGPPPPGEAPPDPVAVLQAALPKQLGLKLEAKKMPVEMFVIDHIEKLPVEN
jgi:uncharacterized protein (TIGR03435 family)